MKLVYVVTFSLLALGHLSAAKEYTIASVDGVEVQLSETELNDLMLFAMMMGDEPIVEPRPANLEDDIENLVILGLFTRDRKDNYTALSVDNVTTLVNSGYNFNAPTKFVIHGYLNNMNNDAIQTPKNAFLDNYDYNVIAVDWGLIATDPLYTVAASQTERVGKYVAQLIDLIISTGVSPDDIHLIGHSLGAHVCGFAGQYTTLGKVGRISGMDPALPAFYDADKNERLDPSDAQFVDCIHTCGGVYGFLKPICDADFYPNGGTPLQPGCPPDLGICSHGRSVTYFGESVYPNHIFPAKICTDRPDASGDGCNSTTINMGYYVPTDLKGIFWTETNSQAPFAPDVE